MKYLFLAINPGSTSTKVSMYEGSDSCNLTELNTVNLSHSAEELERFPVLLDQLPMRCKAVRDFLVQNGSPKLHAVAGRGGLTAPLEAGSYAITQELKDDLSSMKYGSHASNLGAIIAETIAGEQQVPALITDPVGVDEFEDIARYSGWPDLPRRSLVHALNIRSVAREAALDLSKTSNHYPDQAHRDRVVTADGAEASMQHYNFIIAHLGGGISIAAMKAGRIIDVNNANDGGPFSPQRVGTLPTMGLIDLCYSGRFASASDMKKAMTRRGGLMAYLGTDNGQEIINRIHEGDTLAEQVFRAMAYQISKEIGAMAAVLNGNVDAILLTGGLPHPPLSDWIIEQTQWISPVRIYPGEMELLALARAAARHVCEGEPLLTYKKEF